MPDFKCPKCGKPEKTNPECSFCTPQQAVKPADSWAQADPSPWPAAPAALEPEIKAVGPEVGPEGTWLLGGFDTGIKAYTGGGYGDK